MLYWINNCIKIWPIIYKQFLFILIQIKEEDNQKQKENLITPKREQAGPSGINNIHLFESVKTEKLPPIRGPGSIFHNSLLPLLTIDLEKKFAETGISSINQKDFIAHWGSYLWNSTNGETTKKDYFHLASSIVAAYPTLQAGRNGSVRVNY